MIFVAIVLTLLTGLLGASLGDTMNFLELGPILSIATMGGFIISEIKRNNK